jgi:16S rRNA (guanine527-N7)-methyltransferase
VIRCNNPAEFQQATNVSRETLDKMIVYAELLAKWQTSINLVSNKSINDMWHRHFYDSAQLAPIIIKLGHKDPICVDMGSGAGFPALVLAIMGVGSWTLVESDTRKCVFLNEVARQCDISVTIRNERLEGVEDLQADIVTARAFAPLDRLLGFAEGVMKPSGVGIFPKGQRYREELAEAREHWSFSVETEPSDTDDNGNILIMQRVKSV